MRSQRNEADQALAPREKSKGPSRRAKVDKSEDNTMEKLSTQLDSEQPLEGLREKVESGTDITCSPKKKAKFASPHCPDQMKKNIYKKLDSNMEWVMKRITKDPNAVPDSKSKIKLFFNKSVYEVEMQGQEPKKSDHDMKKVYKELKESFNLLYSPDLGDQENRLRKINGISFYNGAFMPPDENCKSVRATKRQDQGALSLACKRDMRSPKQSSLMESKKPWAVTATPKNSDMKQQDGLLSRQVNKASTAVKGSRLTLDSPKKLVDHQLKTQENVVKAKVIHQKVHSNVNLDKRLEKSCVLPGSSTLSTKKSERTMTNLIANESVAKKPIVSVEDYEQEEQFKKHIPSIHRSFSSYYMRNFQRSGIKYPTEKKTYEMHEAEQLEELTPSKGALRDGKKSRSQSRSMKDISLLSSTPANPPSQGLDSFYKLIFELETSRTKTLGSSLSGFISEMIKTMQDFTNRFPHGAPAPEKSVNLPGKSKSSRLH